LAALNDIRALIDGSVPLRTWLETARHLATPRPQSATFQRALDVLDGKPKVAPTQKAPFHVPFLRKPRFVGRADDLAILHDLLQKGGAVGVRPAALTGMGGIGKTQLAVEYAYRYTDAHPGGIYWLNAAEPLQRELARLAVELKLGAEDAPEFERETRLALAFAEYARERPDALVILDNVEDPHTLRGSQSGVIPEQLGCRLLFTTRRRDPDLPFETVDVRVLPEDIALQLLLSSGSRRALLDAGTTTELDAAKTICASLGYLPLALELASAFLARHTRITLGDYLMRIRKEGALAAADAAKVDRRKLGTLHDPAVSATLRAQWDALESNARPAGMLCHHRRRPHRRRRRRHRSATHPRPPSRAPLLNRLLRRPRPRHEDATTRGGSAARDIAAKEEISPAQCDRAHERQAY
jgi:hypothetical protein